MSLESFFNSLFSEDDNKSNYLDDFPNIVKLIYDGVQISQNENLLSQQEGKVVSFNPSLISGRLCPIFLAHSVVNKHLVFKKPNQDLQLIFDLGTIFHELMQKYLKNILFGSWYCRECKKTLFLSEDYFYYIKNNSKKSYFDNFASGVYNLSKYPVGYSDSCENCGAKNSLVYSEWAVVVNDSITGRVDGIIKYNDKFVVLEFKTCSPSVFGSLSLDKEPTITHKFQMSYYMYSLGADYGVLIYFNKSQNLFKQFRISFKDVEDYLFSSFTSINEAKNIIKNGFPSVVKYNSECDYCMINGGLCTPEK